MASTSRASHAKRKPDIFVNFRGEDTRNNFISHLLRETKRHGIFAFTDEGLRGGDDISTTLASSISESRVSVAVFSPNYANSRWCLNELVHIIQCKKQDGQVVLPVFVQGVKPTHVRHQTGPFGDGFKRLIQSGQYQVKKNRWILAMKQTVDCSSGTYDHSSEAEIIEQLIHRILSILDKTGFHDHDRGYFGKHRIIEVKSWLSSQGVRSVGIWGMGGLGKTTLAHKVLAQMSINFDATCFLENVQKHAKRGDVDRLQDYLLSQLLGKVQPNEPPLTSINNSRTMFRLSRISVLIVLDDVSDAGQIQAVMGDWKSFYGRGSKMIATSRDMQVLKSVCDVVYEVQKLDNSDSLQLLQHRMFMERQPTEEQMELLRETAQYARGLPLALEVLGRNLYDKNITIWKSELEKLSNIHCLLSSIYDHEIMEILRSSFDGLNDMDKRIFLDIACLLHSLNRDSAKIALGACEFCPLSNTDRLVDKALISIDPANKLNMHDLLQQMADKIGKDSRLWKWEEIMDLLSENTETNHRRSEIEVISLELYMPKVKKMTLKPDVFKQMPRLRILRLLNRCAEDILLPQGLEYLPNELRYLEWDNYPLPSLPQHFEPKNLVGFRMQNSKLIQLWSTTGKPNLPILKSIDLFGSEKLRELPDLSGAFKLEMLKVRWCRQMEDISHSVKHLVELKHLDLGWTGLTRCPDLLLLNKLEYLCLEGCKKITLLLQLPHNLIELDLSKSGIKELPPSIGHLSQLTRLRCAECRELASLSSTIGGLKHLIELNISECSKLQSLPTSVGDLHSLVELRAYESGLTFLPEEIEGLVNLQVLDLNNCYFLESLPEGIKGLIQLKELSMHNCCRLKSLPEDIKDLAHLKVLDLSSCSGLESLPEGIKGLTRLEVLDMSSCIRMKSLPGGIRGLTNLERLNLSHCTNLKSLPEDITSLVNLEKLDVSNCTNLESLPEGIKHLAHLKTLYLFKCTKLPDHQRHISAACIF